jgi:hypothetical protein
MLIPTPSAAIRARILADGDFALSSLALALDAAEPQHPPTTPEELAAVRMGACVYRRDGSDLSESERRRVAAIVAAGAAH